jgi:pimeloyl-ACP methyl ester carboxylesterase
MSDKPDSTIMTIVLVHGGFVGGSGWEEVYKILKKDGYTVSVVQNPTISLADDVAVTKRVLATHIGPVILVGHSYGGAVITEAGNDPKVAGLVYITAFALDNGESVSALIKDPPPGAPVPPILPPQDGFLFLNKAKFPPHSPPTWTLKRQRSWVTLKSRGVSTHSVARSVRRHGGPSRVGI